ncbi:MAG: superoxide dismutase [Succinivibrionaceae bacterium]|nr:superoxide dismutase [Succinivibrionaceae bacterium]
MNLVLPPLPFGPSDLEPFISAKTLTFHHGKHFKTYVDTANSLLHGSGLEDLSIEEMLTRAQGPLFNNVAQAFNHGFYFEALCAASPAVPEALLGKINASFGDMLTFTELFRQKAVGNFGSGWTWLVESFDGKLSVENTPNAANPISLGLGKPLLVVDVWEHAYYLDYQNRRADYVKDFLGHVDWNLVASRL